MTSSGRRPVSARCDADVWEAARATAKGMAAVDPDYTLSDLIEDALASEVRRLETTHHDGVRWPPADSLRRGRRPMS